MKLFERNLDIWYASLVLFAILVTAAKFGLLIAAAHPKQKQVPTLLRGIKP